MMKKVFAYSVKSRVVWLSDEVFHVPVLDDFYRIHLIENCQQVELVDCIDYSIKFTNKFVQEELVHAPLNEAERNEVLINYEKIKCFSRISDFIQCSLRTSLPSAFFEESDKIEVLAGSVINTTSLGLDDAAKNLSFINTLFQDKKNELKKRYLTTVLKLKNCRSLEEVKEVEYSLVFEGIHVV